MWYGRQKTFIFRSLCKTNPSFQAIFMLRPRRYAVKRSIRTLVFLKDLSGLKVHQHCSFSYFISSNIVTIQPKFSLYVMFLIVHFYMESQLVSWESRNGDPSIWPVSYDEWQLHRTTNLMMQKGLKSPVNTLDSFSRSLRRDRGILFKLYLQNIPDSFKQDCTCPKY